MTDETKGSKGIDGDKTPEPKELEKTEGTKARLSAQTAEEALSRPEGAPSQNSSGTTFGQWAVVIIGILALAGLAADLLWLRPLDKPSDIAALENRLAELEKDQASTRVVAEVDTLKNKFESLNERVGDVAARPNTDPALVNQLEQTGSQLDSLSGRLEALEGQTAGQEGSAMSSEALTQSQNDIRALKEALAGFSDKINVVDEAVLQTQGRIGSLEATAPPEDLDNILNTFSSQNELNALAARMRSLEESDSAEKAHKAALAMAAVELAEATKGSAPFKDALYAVALLAPTDPAVRQLRPYALNGVPTTTSLASRFDGVIHEVQAAERAARYDGFWGQIWARITSLVTIRKVGELEGDSLEAILARAERRTADGDLNAAALEVAKLQGPAADASAAWRQAVGDRARVDDLVRGLSIRVFGALNENVRQ